MFDDSLANTVLERDGRPIVVAAELSSPEAAERRGETSDRAKVNG